MQTDPCLTWQCAEWGLEDAMRQIRSMQSQFKVQEEENIGLKDRVNSLQRSLQVHYRWTAALEWFHKCCGSA